MSNEEGANVETLLIVHYNTYIIVQFCNFYLFRLFRAFYSSMSDYFLKVCRYYYSILGAFNKNNKNQFIN